ncbi:AI-2E family transporter [Microbacterium oxydans]|nr:AI-2E family transporter [Microbacterium oxydans]
MSPTAALIFVIAYLVYIQVEAYVVTPRIMGRAAAVPGVLVIIGAMIGATLLGLLGALVAIPLTASILIVGDRCGSRVRIAGPGHPTMTSSSSRGECQAVAGEDDATMGRSRGRCAP